VAKDTTVRQALDGFLPESYKVIQGTMEDLDKTPSQSLFTAAGGETVRKGVAKRHCDGEFLAGVGMGKWTKSPLFGDPQGYAAGLSKAFRTGSTPTVTLVRDAPVNTACRMPIERSMGCEDDQVMLQDA
jgi:hypothetical protein